VFKLLTRTVSEGNHEKSVKDSPCPSPDSKPGTLRYEEGVLTAALRHFMCPRFSWICV